MEATWWERLKHIRSANSESYRICLPPPATFTFHISYSIFHTQGLLGCNLTHCEHWERALCPRGMNAEDICWTLGMEAFYEGTNPRLVFKKPEKRSVIIHSTAFVMTVFLFGKQPEVEFWERSVTLKKCLHRGSDHLHKKNIGFKHAYWAYSYYYTQGFYWSLFCFSVPYCLDCSCLCDALSVIPL